jgi:hypothetical protein
MRTVEVDVVASSDFAAFMDKLEAKGLDPKVVKWSGPAGGNPLISITGSDEKLREALVNICDVDADDVDTLYLN